MIKQTDAIKQFLNKFTHPDLAGLYSEEMEVQVNVAQENGTKLETLCYTDGINTWYPIRIPKNANNYPEYDFSKLMTYDLVRYCEGIGLTGWDWVHSQSKWVGYDFDALVGHSPKHPKKLTNAELTEITNQVNSIPWITLRKSTSGKGLHLYVFLDPPIPTNNHTEHAALARSILGQLSALCNYDFLSRVDVLGGILWIWHRKLMINWKSIKDKDFNSRDSNLKDLINRTNGLTLEKIGSSLDSIPLNWQDHIPVIQGRRRRTVPKFINSTSDNQSSSIDNPIENLFDELTGQCSRIKLDTHHKQLISYLEESRFTTYFDTERWMLVTHTVGLKEAHQNLRLKGSYETNSDATEPTHPNCYCFPLRGGGWVIRRFSFGVAEHQLWEQDGQGWTKIIFNQEPTLPIAAKANNGVEHKSGSFVFGEADDAIKAAKSLGVEIILPPKMLTHKTKLTEKKSKLIVEIESDLTKDPSHEMEGWLNENKYWSKIFPLPQKIKHDYENEIYNYDDIIRHVISEDSNDLGWFIKNQDGGWNSEPLQHVRAVLEGNYNYTPKESKQILGSNIIKPWKLVNRPFDNEYPGERLWNRNSAQLRFIPNTDNEINTPTWDSILSHCGANLDYIIKNHEWCTKHNILTGADYLKLWIASAIQQPYEHLPYLFFYGKENSGKSTFHDAISLLMTTGYTRCDSALNSSNLFNGELEGAVIAVIEETDFQKNKIAANRIKDWVNSSYLPIHAKHRTPYLIPNTIHFIQCSNDRNSCPIFTGDTRITMIRVNELETNTEIPKRIIKQLLEKEAPSFLSQIKNLELPTPTGRLNLPVISTDEKADLQESNRTAIEAFFDDECYFFPGKTIFYSELYEYFKATIDPSEIQFFTINKFGKELPPQYPKGRIHGSDPNLRIGNISFREKPTFDDLKKPKLIKMNGYLVPETTIRK